MKTLDGIKKLNAVKKADGELLIEAIDLKELKGAKERDLAEAFLTAIEGIPEKDEQFIPEELAELYNKLAEETVPLEEEKEVAKPAAKAAKKSEVKETAKPAAKAAKESEAKPVDKKKEPEAKKPEAAKKEVPKTDGKKPAAKAEVKKVSPKAVGNDVDVFGFRKGSVVSSQAGLLKAGKSTMAQIKEKTGSTCYDLIKRLRAQGNAVVKDDNGILTLKVG
jgi:outer membrane biosynthesis protein TonB